jgi:hypothetical protein
MAAGIVFLAIIQLKIPLNDPTVLQFEVGKSLLATALWIWLMLDSAFGPWQNYWHNEDEKIRRLTRSATASLLLMYVFQLTHHDDNPTLSNITFSLSRFVFYPPLIYAYTKWKRSRMTHTMDVSTEPDEQSNRPDEQTPLLSS